MNSLNITGRHLLRMMLLTACLLLVACATTISQNDLLKIIREQPAQTIVDVRSSGEYATDHLPGALHIPFYSIVSGLKGVGVPQERPLYIYCEHGPRSGLAGLTLYLYGYRNVYTLEGNMKGWREHGLPVEKIHP